MTVIVCARIKMADSSVKQATIRRREVAELFDKIKSKPGFFAPKEKMQHQWDKWKIPEPVFDWTPESIQGIDFVNACILAFRPYFADADRIQSFFTYAGILEEYGIVKEVRIKLFYKCDKICFITDNSKVRLQ